MIKPRRSPVWVTLGCVLLVVAGGALLWLPIHTQLALDDWMAELRATGVPARALVYDRVTEAGGNRESSSTTMFVRYELSGRTYEQEVGCFEVCRPPGHEMSIWVNPADPEDFVTDFDQLSGHRGRAQGVLGAVGFGILVLAIPLLLSRIPFGRLFPRRDTPPRRSAAPALDGGRFTGASKHKRRSRR
ncbi:DUF3592 domain-containing protein [Micromonospora sp. NPDC000316]|uniref:DUF3592 domain-containing protein n=1 Tax=Micromonospora sp. NPDC000316 TaxID=3364216 RepID=UPI0036B9199F